MLGVGTKAVGVKLLSDINCTCHGRVTVPRLWTDDLALMTMN